MTRPRHLIATAILCAALVTTTAACTPGDPEPTPTATTPTTTPTPTPTPTPTLSARDQDIEAAKTAYQAFRAADDAAAQTGYAEPALFDAVRMLATGDVLMGVVSSSNTFRERGVVQVGDTVLKSLEATDYIEAPSGSGGNRATLKACVDLTATDNVFVATGESTTPAGVTQYKGPRVIYVTMQRQSDGRWQVDTSDARPEETC